MARDKAESSVESVGFAASFIARKLHLPASAARAFGDRPLDHLLADPKPSPGRGHPHCLDLSSPRSLPRKAWHEAKLESADNLLAIGGDDEELMRVDIDCRKRGPVSFSACFQGFFSRPAEHIVAEELNDRVEIVRSCAPKDYFGHPGVLAVPSNGSKARGHEDAAKRDGKNGTSHSCSELFPYYRRRKRGGEL